MLHADLHNNQSGKQFVNDRLPPFLANKMTHVLKVLLGSSSITCMAIGTAQNMLQLPSKCNRWCQLDKLQRLMQCVMVLVLINHQSNHLWPNYTCEVHHVQQTHKFTLQVCTN